jgi:putative membrane protein
MLPSLSSQAALTAFSTACIVGSGVSLLLGWYFIRRRRVPWHKRAMLAASGLAAAFLVAYVARWALYGSKPFAGEGMWRAVYLGILVPHILLALLLAPAAVYLLYLALARQDFARHKWWARRVLPVWLFVAASGWVIYWLLYQARF